MKVKVSLIGLLIISMLASCSIFKKAVTAQKYITKAIPGNDNPALPKPPKLQRY